MEDKENTPMTIPEFIESCYSGLKAKFDLSTDEEKDAIIERLNKVQSGLGTALSKEREDLESMISNSSNQQEIVDALLPMTSLHGIRLVVDQTEEKQEEKKSDSKNRHKAKESNINTVQPMFVLQSKDESLNESTIQSKEEKLLEALKEQNQRNKTKACVLLWLVMVPLLIAIITFTGLIFMRLDEQGRSITDIFSENTQVSPIAEPIIV